MQCVWLYCAYWGQEFGFNSFLMGQQSRLIYNAHSGYKNTEDLYCCYATFQHCNYLTTLCPQCPQFVLLPASWSTSFCSFTPFQSASHCCPSPLCMGRVLLPSEQNQTPQTKETSQNLPEQIPNPWGPQTPWLALHSQDKAHTMELLLHLESNRIYAWCFDFFSDSFITGRKMNICIFSTSHDTCGVVKKDKSCIRTDAAADQAIPLSSPAASLPPLSFLL